MKRHWFWMIAAAFAALVLCGISLAEVTPDLSFFPREAIAVGDSLDFDFSDIDRTMDHYVHVLREEADGTYTVVAAEKAWDAAAGTEMSLIEADVVTEPGNYWLTLGPDPDYTGIDGENVLAAPFKALEKKLAAPVIENLVYGSAIGTDVRFSTPLPEGAAMVYVEVGTIKDGLFSPDYWDTDGPDHTVLGLYTTEPGTYQIRATACPQFFGEPVSDTVADSDTVIYEFTLAPGEIPPCPAPVLPAAEADYSPEGNRISLTVPGAEAVAYNYQMYNPVTGESEAGTGMPMNSTAGDTDTIYLFDGPGEYHIYCWGRLNGVWSATGETVFNLNPMGYLDIPTVSRENETAESELHFDSAGPLLLTVTCENAEMISCELEKKIINEGFDWLDWIDLEPDENGTAILDLTAHNLADGTYRLRVVAFRDGYIRRGDRTIILTVGETDETVQGTIPEP